MHESEWLDGVRTSQKTFVLQVGVTQHISVVCPARPVTNVTCGDDGAEGEINFVASPGEGNTLPRQIPQMIHLWHADSRRNFSSP